MAQTSPILKKSFTVSPSNAFGYLVFFIFSPYVTVHFLSFVQYDPFKHLYGTGLDVVTALLVIFFIWFAIPAVLLLIINKIVLIRKGHRGASDSSSTFNADGTFKESVILEKTDKDWIKKVFYFCSAVILVALTLSWCFILTILKERLINQEYNDLSPTWSEFFLRHYPVQFFIVVTILSAILIGESAKNAFKK